MHTRPLTALLISDGKPGHYYQAEGVIAALRRLRPIVTHRIEVRRRFLIPTRTLLTLVNADASPALVLGLGYGLRLAHLPPADVVVSAGGETLAANAAAARHLGAANIFCGRLRRLASRHVRLVIVSLERFVTEPNYLVALPPSPIDLARRAGGQAPTRYGRANPPRRAALLIGGNSGAFRYSPEDWRQLLDFLRAAQATLGTRWLATTSRRSGAFIGDALAAMAAEPEGAIARFIDFRTAGPGTLPEIFAAADAILCTDDSTTMISEAVAACLPVVSVTPAAAAIEAREAEYRQVLASHGWYRPLRLSELTPQTFLAALEEITPRTSSQLDELAAALSSRLPDLLAKP